MPLLTDLLASVSEKPEAQVLLNVTGISADSRKIQSGNLFVALQGSKAAGADYVMAARKAGAIAVLCAMDLQLPECGVPVIRVANPRLALAQLAAAFYPKQPEHMVAITGTDGKTSTADFFRQFWHHMGKKSASFGTLGTLSGAGEVLAAGTHTTPDPVELHRVLAEMVAKNISHVAMEASSHGLHQYRLDGVRLEAAAFTNIARDHLDYHKNEEDYFAAKLRLFSELLPTGKTAVLNADDVRFAVLSEICARRNITVMDFGRNAKSLRIDSLTPHNTGQHAKLMLMGKLYTLDIPLVGGFQVMNILAALGLSVVVGADMEGSISVISKFKGVPGRLEHVATLANGASVYVDYAHTPMALANILQTLRPHTPNKLHVVFGCGGDRDAGKRPEMGKVAARLADNVIITDDNPRSERPELIRSAIKAAAPTAKEVADRKEAIYVALQMLEPNDILVIAGKGHEKTQIVGDKVLPFDDVEIARQAAGGLQ
ncbi:MAG: UDP-N-acetylmuramoyl-L-alanyl-D-glutamate--2,6-diaminopimelate ligase [Alphaproteobacteria bacterium]